MTDSVQKHEDKEVRGRILKALDFEFPRAMSLQMISYVLQASRYDCSTGQLKAHLAYLAQKGYITLESVGLADMDLRREMVTLTAKGKDLVEESIPADPGVILNV